MKPTTSDSTGQAGTRPVIREITRPDTRLAFPAMQALRADYADEAAFVQRVDEVQRPEGYRRVDPTTSPRDLPRQLHRLGSVTPESRTGYRSDVRSKMLQPIPGRATAGGVLIP